MKSIFFHELNIKNIFIILIFSLFKFNIFYIKINKKLRKKFIIKFFIYINCKWYNYQNFDYLNPHSNIIIPKNNLAERFSKKITTLSWNKFLKFIFLEEKNLNACLHQRCMNGAESMYEVYAIAKFHLENGKKIYLWIPNNLLSQEMLNDESRIVNLCPKFITFFDNIVNFSFKILNFAIAKISNFHKRFKKNENKSNTHDASDFKICFFPHKGVDNLNYKKNYFYSNNKDNPFYYSKILHFEWSQLDIPNNSPTAKFYKEKDIKVLFWNILIRKTNFFKINFLLLFLKVFFSLIKSRVDFENIIAICSIFYRVEENKIKLSYFKNLKVALVGYEILFPQPLAVACRLKKINLVAVQERTLSTAYGYQFLLDKYFITGPQSKKDLENRLDKKMEIIETGLIKTKQNLEEAKEIKIDPSNNFKLKCLVMDYHSVGDWYVNGRDFIGNWKKNLNFYKVISSLAKNNKEILFLIKGKNYFWLKINFFKDIIKDLNNLDNVKILDDINEWTPSNCIKNTDFGIALMTSLADEMIVSGKPVIIFERDDFPSCFLDYGPDVISKDLKDLNYKVDAIKSNLKTYNEKINPIRKKFYKKFDKDFFYDQIQKLTLNL